MGISHEYHSTSHRARHGGVSGKLRLAGAVLAILVLAYAITAILENGASAKDAQSEPVASGIAQDILAPLPMQGEAADSDSSGDSTAPDGSEDAQAVTLETFGPARQDAAAAVVKAYDASVIRQPSCGQVDLNYFADAAFLGDSLTVGFSDYQINLGGALVCGYTGVGPDAIVNRTAVKSSVRGKRSHWMCWPLPGPKSCISYWAPTPSPRWVLPTGSWPITARCWTCCGRRWGRTA